MRGAAHSDSPFEGGQEDVPFTVEFYGKFEGMACGGLLEASAFFGGGV